MQTKPLDLSLSVLPATRNRYTALLAHFDQWLCAEKYMERRSAWTGATICGRNVGAVAGARGGACGYLSRTSNVSLCTASSIRSAECMYAQSFHAWHLAQVTCLHRQLTLVLVDVLLETRKVVVDLCD
eukprot:1327721-Amphidinium_carterae.1